MNFVFTYHASLIIANKTVVKNMDSTGTDEADMAKYSSATWLRIGY